MDWSTVIEFLAATVCLVLLWRLAGKLRDPRIDRCLGQMFSEMRRLAVYSAETTTGREAEFINERWHGYSAAVAWCARGFLLFLYYEGLSSLMK